MWHCGVVVIATAQLHSTRPWGMSEIHDGEDL